MERQEINFTVRWNIRKYRPRIKEIKRRVTLILQLAQADFSAISEIIRTFNAGLEIPSPRCAPVSEATKLLQYVDTLSQKLNHIILINDALIRAKIKQPKSSPAIQKRDAVDFIFKLHYLQAQMANREFLSTTTTLKLLLEKFSDTSADNVRYPFCKKPFENLKRVTANMNFLLATLHAVYIARLEEQLHAVCPDSDLEQLARVYTMHSERLILEWLHEHPQGDVHELTDVYAHSRFGEAEQQTDFF